MPRLSASSFIRLIEAMAGGFLRVIGNIPKALRLEIDYYLCRRRRASLILTWGCTSRCSSCTVWKRPLDSAAELTLEEWLETARKLVSRGVRIVELFGGDVFLRKDVLIPLARELKSLGCTIHIPTNCNLIDHNTAKAMVDNLDFLYLSVDGIEDLHDHIRGIRGTFNKVINALELLREERGNRNRPVLICNTTVSRYNVHDLSQIADFAAEAGFDEIHFEYVCEFTPD